MPCGTLCARTRGLSTGTRTVPSRNMPAADVPAAAHLNMYSRICMMGPRILLWTPSPACVRVRASVRACDEPINVCCMHKIQCAPRSTAHGSECRLIGQPRTADAERCCCCQSPLPPRKSAAARVSQSDRARIALDFNSRVSATGQAHKKRRVSLFSLTHARVPRTLGGERGEENHYPA